MMLNIAKDSVISIGGLGMMTELFHDNLDGCIKDVRINGQQLPNSKSNNIATVTERTGNRFMTVFTPSLG